MFGCPLAEAVTVDEYADSGGGFFTSVVIARWEPEALISVNFEPWCASNVVVTMS